MRVTNIVATFDGVFANSPRLRLAIVLFVGGCARQPPPLPTQPAVACKFDTAAVTRPEYLVIGLAPGPQLPSGRAIPTEYTLAAQAIKEHYRAPETISLPFWARVAGDDTLTTHIGTSDIVGHGLDGEIQFRLTAAGRLVDSTVDISTASPEVNASLQAAVRRADSAAAFPPLRRERGAVVLRLIDWTKRKGSAVELVGITIPMVHADSFAKVSSMSSIVYPRGPRAGGVSSSVLLQFVITDRGRAVPTSLRILEAEYREFVVAVANAVVRATFAPPYVSGCPVPTQVRLRVDFKIRR